ncbi:MAG: DUF2341 domain-containing protein, partial [Bacteroidia bacterium]|nr:DUF2341 domain-containing protein [Bacteroidia bacterium]
MTKGKLFTVFIVLFFSIDCLSQAVCSYNYRKRITFNPAQVAGSSDLTNFTALISITSDNDLRSTANGGHVASANGYDIIFVSADGVTKLDHQLEKYTATTGELVTWVRIPNLSTSINTYIYMYYGNSGATGSDQSVTSTWSSAYKGVWHLNNSIADATSNGNNGTNSGSTNTVTAKIAGGRVFPGTGTNYLQVPLSGANGGGGNGSVSFWGKVSSYTTSTYFFGETTNQTGYANRVQLYLGDAAGNLYLGLGGSHVLQTNIVTMSLNTWYHVMLTWASTGTATGTYSMFVNGVSAGSGSYSGFSAIHTFADLGNDGNASQRTEELPGQMDEVHITNTTLSSSWAATEYANQNSPSTFYSISAEPNVFTGASNANWSQNGNWTSGSAPSASTDVIITTTTSNQPNLNTNIQLNSLWIKSSNTLNINNNQNLSIL